MIDGIEAVLTGLDRVGILAIINAYFDESEQQHGEEEIALAGYLFKKAEYRRLRSAWQELLWSNGARILHATDLYAGRKEFEGMSIRQRATIYKDAIEIVNARALAGVGVLFKKTEFEAKAPPDWPHYFGSIYSAACQMCLRATVHQLESMGRTDWVNYFFETGHKYQAEANALVNSKGKTQSSRKRYRYLSHAFVLKETVGIQTADLLAWSVRKAYSDGILRGPAAQSFAVAMKEFAFGPKLPVHVFTDANLERFFEEHLSMTEVDIVNVGPRKKAFR